MFERFTDRAKRALFFARYETSEFGDMSIDTQHLLLGILRESKGVTAEVLAQLQLSFADVRAEIQAGTGRFREKVPTSVEIPFTEDTKRALMFAGQEADLLAHSYIGSEHLLLGLLRTEGSVAAKLLEARGIELAAVRSEVARLSHETPGAAAPQTVHRLALIQSIERLVDELGTTRSGTPEAQELIDRICAEIEMLKKAIAG